MMPAREWALTQADWSMLFCVARRLTRNRADAEDAVQDACFRVWLGGHWRGDSSFRTYLYAAVRSSVLNQSAARRCKKRGFGCEVVDTSELVDMPEMVSSADPLKAAMYWRKLEAAND